MIIRHSRTLCNRLRHLCKTARKPKTLQDCWSKPEDALARARSGKFPPGQHDRRIARDDSQTAIRTFIHEAVEQAKLHVLIPGIDQQKHSALVMRHRAALTLRYFEEMDYRTIENTLGSRTARCAEFSAAPWRMRKQLRPLGVNGLNLWQPSRRMTTARCRSLRRTRTKSRASCTLSRRMRCAENSPGNQNHE